MKIVVPAKISGISSLKSTSIQPLAPSDPDAAAYIAAVELQDGQSLEQSVKNAINNFVLGCKSDAIWTGMQQIYILAGARTLNGALVPLKGTAPTNNSFITSDYSRSLGLIGDGSTKYLNTNRSSNQDSLTNKHIAVYLSQAGVGGVTFQYVTGNANSGTMVSLIYSGTLLLYYYIYTGGANFLTNTPLVGFKGFGRSSATSVDWSINGTPGSITNSYTNFVVNKNQYLFATNTGANVSGPAGSFAVHRISFYSVGSYINSSLLNARVDTLMAAYASL